MSKFAYVEPEIIHLIETENIMEFGKGEDIRMEYQSMGRKL